MADNRKRRRSSSDTDSDDYIQWKISKLKRRLATKARLKNKGLGVFPSTSASVVGSIRDQPSCSRHQDDILSLPESDNDDLPLSVFTTDNSGIAAAGASEPIIAEEESSTLDLSILALLGYDRPSPELLGPQIQVDLASRWTFILSNGLGEESVSTLIKKYPPAENCTLLKRPRVNPEVASAINDQVARRDSNLINLQNQIGAALSALGQLTTDLVSEEGEVKHKYIELASDASRLLLDFHHKYSVIRCDLLMLNLRKDLKDILTTVSTEGWLFGNNLGERIKASKDIEKSGLELKLPKASSSNIPFKQPTKKVPVNSIRPPRRVQTGISRGGRQLKTPVVTQSFQRRSYQSQRKTTDQVHHRRQERRPNHR